jgi:hypothetical protein
MKKTIILVVVIAMSIGTTFAQWGNNNNRPDGRYNNPRTRVDEFQREARLQIGNGIISGQISSGEAQRLLGDLERIERKEGRYWRDGVLDNSERRELGNDLADLSRQIRKEKYNADRSTYDDYRHNDNRIGDRRRF